MPFNVALRWLGDAALAERATVATFQKVVEGVSRYKLEASFRPWFFGRLREACRPLERAAAGADAAAPGEASPSGEGALVPHSARTFGRAPGVPAHVTEAVAIAVGALPAEEREAYLLRELAQLDFDEIASALELPPAAVRRLVRGALDRLARALEPFEEFERVQRALPAP